MFNYNLINPVNINYRKYPTNGKDANSPVQNNEEKKSSPLTPDNKEKNREFPNGNKVAIDYTKSRVNISQVLQDFRSTISAINTPKDIEEEVEIYLSLVEKESVKQAPSREIILANLKNAARLTDKYIQESLKKPSSKVVEDWVDALFLQQVNIKADPKEINEDFRVQIPKKTIPQATKNTSPSGIKPLTSDTVDFSHSSKKESVEKINSTPVAQEAILNEEPTKILTVNEKAQSPKTEQPEEKIADNNGAKKLYEPKTKNEILAKEALQIAKRVYANDNNAYQALKMFDRAIKLLDDSDNSNLKAAIYFERGKIFDSFDYLELALVDYHKATKADDNNLKTQAHIKMGNIYDDYIQIDPALNQYTKAIKSSEEANNLYGKTRALRYIASMFAGQFDVDSTESFTELALESAIETSNPKTIANTYLEAAKNYQYIGAESKALKMYGALAREEAVQEEYDVLALNYKEASLLMDKKGNKRKSEALMQKSKEYQRLARMQRDSAA